MTVSVSHATRTFGRAHTLLKMKLLYCIECASVFGLKESITHCACGKSSGRYLDIMNAEYEGPCLPLGFANATFAPLALRPGVTSGDAASPKRFIAFVIQKKCDTMKRLGEAPMVPSTPIPDLEMGFCRTCMDVCTSQCTAHETKTIVFEGSSFGEAIRNQPELDWGKEFLAYFKN
jgi:hypothetical protein